MARTIGFIGAALLCATVLARVVHAQSAYPSQPIKWIVPVPAGGIVDRVARAYADKLRDSLGQPVLIENKPGGNTLIGTQQAAQAPADGHTFLSITPAVVIRPIWLVASVNQRFPSGPAAIAPGPWALVVVWGANSLITPVVVMRPILLPDSVNQRAPSGPATMPA